MNRDSRRARRVRADLGATVLACTALFGLACGPGAPPADPEPEAPRSFALEGVTLGVAFHEPVVVEGGAGSTDPSETTGVSLAPDESPGHYTGALRASDPSGNTTEVQLEVTVGDSEAPS